MYFPIEKKLVVAIASSALFDLTESDEVFRTEGEEDYRKFQREKQNEILKPGVAFPFIKRLLNLNTAFPTRHVEVILLSKNDPDTGLRVFNTIGHYNLQITRAGFLSGAPPYEYLPAFNATLFLSANPQDVRSAILAGHPAGTVLKTRFEDDPEDNELRVAFDFDGVIVDDQAEAVYQQEQNLGRFYQTELNKVNLPHAPGPLKELFMKLCFFQKLERKKTQEDPTYKRYLIIAIVTSRNAPAHERMVTTLRNWGVNADKTFFLGGIEKRKILSILRPHVYFDDQMDHLQSAAKDIPSVHIPFGIMNVDRIDDGRGATTHDTV